MLVAAKDIGRNGLSAEAWTAWRCDGDGLVEDVADAVASERPAPGVGECGAIGGAVEFYEPGREGTAGLGPQRDTPVFATLAVKREEHGTAEGDL
jgi:hypothetical protein